MFNNYKDNKKLEIANEIIIGNLNNYVQNILASNNVIFPDDLNYLDKYILDTDYDIGLFLNVPEYFLTEAVSILLFKKPIQDNVPIRVMSLVIKRRLLLLTAVAFIPWRKAKIHGLVMCVGRSIASKNKYLNSIIKYIYRKFF